MIRKFGSYTNQDIGTVLDCFLEFEDIGFKIGLKTNLTIDAYPYGFLYNPEIWNEAKRQWNNPWLGDPSKIPTIRGGVITHSNPDLIRIDISGSESLIKGINFYKYLLHLCKSVTGNSFVDTESYQHLEIIRKNPLLKKIYNLTGFYLHHCYYNDLVDNIGCISLEFIYS